MKKHFHVTWLMFLAFAVVAGPAGASEFSLRQAPLVRDEGIVQSPSPFTFADASTAADGEKSTSKAVMYTLLVPGLGHHYLGEDGTARAFFIAEAAIWTAFIVYQVQGHLREDAYQEFAQTFAGVTSTDHSDEYYRLLTEYNSSTEYADDIKSDGRFELYPNLDTATLDQYFVDNRIADYEAWVWQSADLRRDYQNRRASSRSAYRRSVYMLATAFANRVVSTIFVVKAARANEREGSSPGTSFRLEFGASPDYDTDGFQTGVTFVRKF